MSRREGLVPLVPHATFSDSGRRAPDPWLCDDGPTRDGEVVHQSVAKPDADRKARPVEEIGDRAFRTSLSLRLKRRPPWAKV